MRRGDEEKETRYAGDIRGQRRIGVTVSISIVFRNMMVDKKAIVPAAYNRRRSTRRGLIECEISRTSSSLPHPAARIGFRPISGAELISVIVTFTYTKRENYSEYPLQIKTPRVF